MSIERRDAITLPMSFNTVAGFRRVGMTFDPGAQDAAFSQRAGHYSELRKED
jgi:hypothetical protein